MTKDEALDKALEALEEIINWYGVRDKNDVMMPPLNQNPEIKESMDAITAIKQARALDKMAENARELGLDYEPAEVLGHNGWGFPIKAAAPVQKKCDCAAHSAADCVCGAWDKSAVAPVQEDWGPGPHECHSLIAAPVQEPVAFFDPQGKGFYWAKPTKITAPVTVDVEPLSLYTTPPAAQRQWVGLTDEEVRETISSVHIEPLFSYRHVARAIEAKLKELNT